MLLSIFRIEMADTIFLPQRNSMSTLSMSSLIICLQNCLNFPRGNIFYLTGAWKFA
jgi:hypothetical protein